MKRFTLKNFLAATILSPMTLLCLVRTVLICVLTVSISKFAIGADKKETSSCSKPREVATPPGLTKEEQKRARTLRAQGVVSISINEDGDIVDAKVVRASSSDAVEILIEYLKPLKFKARPGCGTTHAVINFTLANS